MERLDLKSTLELMRYSVIALQANGSLNDAIVPSVEGWARITGYNTIFIDDRDPYAHGFQLA